MRRSDAPARPTKSQAAFLRAMAKNPEHRIATGGWEKIYAYDPPTETVGRTFREGKRTVPKCNRVAGGWRPGVARECVSAGWAKKHEIGWDSSKKGPRDEANLTRAQTYGLYLRSTNELRNTEFWTITEKGVEASKREPLAGNTKKPWPCCGRKVSDSPYVAEDGSRMGWGKRPTDVGICPKCRALMDDGERYRDEESASDLVACRIPRLSVSHRGDRDAATAMEEAMRDLFNVLGTEPSPEALRGRFKELGEPWSSGERVWFKALMLPEHAIAYAAVWAAARDQIETAYKEGHREGRSIIEGLNAGDIGLVEFDKVVARVTRDS